MNFLNNLMKVDLVLVITFLCFISAHSGPAKTGFLVFALLLFLISLVYHIRNLRLYKKFY